MIPPRNSLFTHKEEIWSFPVSPPPTHPSGVAGCVAGQVSGLLHCFQQLFTPQFLPTMTAAWEALKDMGFLVDPLGDSEVGLRDVLVFLITFVRHRRSTGARPLGPRPAEALNLLKDTLVMWIAVRLDMYVLQAYVFQHIVDKAIPSLRLNARGPTGARNRSGKRQYTFVSPQNIWGFFQQARESSTSVRMIMKIRLDFLTLAH